ncbi:transglutaminase-like cysteine peptidase [Campylobacter sp. RM16192]|uniref:transglutaminase-like cysteine peptidase n=1 Tax=Campylobacter sp. RM16192 TaxID=1660080 RepID=UPI001451F928|nr:transglutaminase-like cysteine peptidase [Campylobacter sp. RM16192]QCD53108.1 putative transglutaminase-like cysteine proteinase [Campylobacter sp. RM16192]
MIARINTDKTILMALFLSAFFLFFLFAENEFIKASTYEKIAKIYGENAKKRVVGLNKLMVSLKNSTEQEKLLKINDYFNLLTWKEDQDVWGKKDYWATRMEFLGKGAGDCEDFVTAKYFTLKQLGISTKKLYFTYVKAIKYNQAHMVLSYYDTPKSIPLILDNINPKIRVATQRKDLVPVYSFNGDSLFLSKQEGLGQAIPGGNKKQNPKWLNLVDRMKEDG